MKKLSLIYVAVILAFIGCSRNDLIEQVEKPTPKEKVNITITGDSMITTRSTNDRVEFTGGYATGAGLYDGDAQANVQAVPYSGYQLKSFTGGPVGGNSSQFTGSNQYGFKIQGQDWKFSVSFKKEYTITVNAGIGGSASGSGTVLEGENCTVTAYVNTGYNFDGWYEGSSKVSNSKSYTFTVSSNRTFRIG